MKVRFLSVHLVCAKVCKRENRLASRKEMCDYGNGQKIKDKALGNSSRKTKNSCHKMRRRPPLS